MRTIHNIKALFVIGLVGVAGVVNAQDNNLNRELTLEREYDPSVQDANKVNTLPVVKEPQVERRAIDYASYTFPVDPAKEITILPSGNIYTDMFYNKRRGYFNFGAGTYANINGDLGYHILNTDKDQLNIFFSHRSTNGNVKYLDDSEKVKAKLNDNLGGVGFRHVFRKATMNLGFKYGYTGFNYYGMPLPTGIGTSNEELDLDQVNQRVQVNAGVRSNDNEPFGYLLDISYRNFSQKHASPLEDAKGITEHTLGLRLGANAGFGINQLIGVEGMVNYFNGTPAESESTFGNYAELTVTPYYKVYGDNWNVKLGANVMIITGDNSKFFVSPNIAADIEVADKTVLYLNADGEIRSNSAYEISQYNLYMNPGFRSYPANTKDVTSSGQTIYPWVKVIPSRTWLDGTIGLKSGVAPGFWFNLFAGYKITDRDLLFVQNGFSGYPNVSVGMPVNTKLFKAGLEMKYAWQKLVDISLKGVYNSWNLSVDDDVKTIYTTPDEPYGRPKFEFSAGLDLRPIDRFTFTFNYLMASGRYALDGSEAVKMKNINELNFTGLYKFNDTFGVYVKLNNLLFQKYELIYGYPLQKFGAMAGVNINF